MPKIYGGGTSGGSVPIGPAGGDLSGTYPNPEVVAIEETSGPDRLDIGAIQNQSLLARVGTSIVSAALGAGLSFLAGSLQLSEVNNLIQGVLPAITSPNAVPVSNGSGTASTWQALSGGGSPVGTGRIVSNAQSGLVPQTNGIAGQALISTSTGSVWSTDFQNQNLTTSGIFVASSASNAMNVGSVLPTTGSYRWAHGVDIYGRTTGGANRRILDWGVGSADNLQLGDDSTSLIIRGTASGTGIIFRLGGNTKVSIANASFTVQLQTLGWEASQTPILQQAVRTSASATGSVLSIIGQDCNGATSTGGDVYIIPGTGTSANGSGRLRTPGALNRFIWNDTGISFFNATVVGKQTLTNSTGGVAANDLVDVTSAGVSDPVKVNANFASIWTKINNYGLWS